MTPTPKPNPSLSNVAAWLSQHKPTVQVYLTSAALIASALIGSAAAWLRRHQATVGLGLIAAAIVAVDWRLGSAVAGCYLVADEIAATPAKPTDPTDPQ